MKAVYPFWIVCSLCQVVQVGLNIWMFADNGSRREYLALAIQLIFFFSRALQHIADILLFITFVEIGSGFVLCLNGAKKAPSRKQLRYAAFGWSVVLLTLALTHFGLRIQADFTQKSRLKELDGFDTDAWAYPASEAGRKDRLLRAEIQDAHFDSLVKSSRLHSTVNICLWITSLPTLAFASYVLHHTKENIMLKKAATLYLTSTILTFCRLLVTMGIYLSEYENFGLLWFEQSRGYTDIRTSILPIIEAFFNFALMFIALTLLFVVAVRKRRGLWSNSQMTWDASNKLSSMATGSSPTSETPGYLDDGLQEQGFCLEHQQAEASSHPMGPQPFGQALLPSATAALPQQLPAAAHLDPEPISTRRDRIPRRPLAPSTTHSPTESASRSSIPSSPQSIHTPHGGCMRRERTIEELDAQKVLLPEGSPIHPSQMMDSGDDGGGVADGFQMQDYAHLSAGPSSTRAVATNYHTRQIHHPPQEDDTELDTVVDGFQMQGSAGSSQRRMQDMGSSKPQKIQSDDEPPTEPDTVADGFQMQTQGSSELPTYAEAGGETTTTRTGFGYLREKDDQDKKARGRARSF
ncbi:hypothetical protein QBC41DRAFT_353804 [Cercophora samala]|uniref:Uncharacterized protein n=1 Tax=Cercophora samala TaxID=330535 RepID=A0AA40DCP7_9PEZI|nr:hypothetical protein QBC41DRAFT_353804 [Cercophora samala]